MEKILFEDALNVVKKLNEEFCECYNNFSSFFPVFELRTDGFLFSINFMKQFLLWSSEEDERDFDENKYEPLEQYLRREGQKIIDRIGSLRLN